MDAKEKQSNVYGKQERELIETILGIRKDSKRKATLQLALESARFHCGIDGNGNIDNFTFTTRQQFIVNSKMGWKLKCHLMRRIYSQHSCSILFA